MRSKDKNISRKEASSEKSGVVVSDSVGNYEKHPFFIRKATAAKTLLLKVGLPKHLTRKEPA
jgi:hypothetical protein